MKPTTPAPPDVTPAAVAGIVDPVSRVRAAAIPAAAAIPRPPDDYRPYDAKAGQHLNKVGEDLRAEGKAALAECVGLGKEMLADLGPNAPDPQHAAALVARIASIEAAKTLVNQLLAFLNQADSVAMNDLSDVVGSVNDLYEANLKHNNALKTRYTKVVTFIAAQGKAISAGIAVAKALAEAKKNGGK